MKFNKWAIIRVAFDDLTAKEYRSLSEPMR